MANSPFALARAIGIWLMLIAVESVHGVMRRLFLEPYLGDLPARRAGVLTGAVLIILVFWFTLKWLGPQPGWRWWEMGLLWLTLTLAFEIGLGGAAGLSRDRMASEFDPRRGGFLGLGMLVILVAPRALAARLGLIVRALCNRVAVVDRHDDGHGLRNEPTADPDSTGGHDDAAHALKSG